eukprot:4987128-Prymnesium_polylepis.1
MRPKAVCEFRHDWKQAPSAAERTDAHVGRLHNAITLGRDAMAPRPTPRDSPRRRDAAITKIA